MTESEWRELVAQMNAAWPHSPLGLGYAEVWYPIVADIPKELAYQGLGLWVEDPEKRKFPPNGGDLVEMVRVLAGDGPLAFDDVWTRIMRAVRYVGAWGVPQFENPAVARLVEAIGWQNICATELEDLGVLRAQMRRMWEDSTKRQRVESYAERQGLPDPASRPGVSGLVEALAQQKAIGDGRP